MVRTPLSALAGLVALAGAAALASCFLPVANHAVLLLAASAPFLLVGAGLGGAALLANRRWRAAATAAAVAVAALLVATPQFADSGQIGGVTAPIRVLTANLRDGAVGPEAVSAAAERADILLVQELTPELAEALDRRGFAAVFPFRAIEPRRWAAGVGIFSRYPIVASRRVAGFELGALCATVRPPGAAADAVVMSVHLVGPWPQAVDQWRAEIAALPEALAGLAADAGGGAVIVGGDFNASASMRPFRELLRDGFRDAAGQSGAGLIATYPADTAAPPLIAIDHILTRNASASQAQAVRVAGSDHLGVAATVLVPGRSQAEYGGRLGVPS